MIGRLEASPRQESQLPGNPPSRKPRGCYNGTRSPTINRSCMTNFSKPINRALFVLCVIVTGSIAGAFVWAFFFLMDKGI